MDKTWHFSKTRLQKLSIPLVMERVGCLERDGMESSEMLLLKNKALKTLRGKKIPTIKFLPGKYKILNHTLRTCVLTAQHTEMAGSASILE